MAPRSVQGGLGLVLAAAVSMSATGCDQRDSPSERPFSGKPDPVHAREVARDPYLLACRDLANQTSSPESAKLVIRAEFALAREPVLVDVVEKQTLNRTGRSVYYALTEICKGRPQSFRPARLAVEGVRRGEYRAARGRPG